MTAHLPVDGEPGRLNGGLPGQRPAAGKTRVRVAGLDFDRIDEPQVVDHIMQAAEVGQGGWVATPNIDICRAAHRNPAHRTMLAGASLVVPDGMPLLWAAKLQGEPLIERVTGASLIFSLAAAAARQGLSIYLLGGEPGVPDRAGEELARRYPGLVVAGADAPPIGFDATEDGLEAVRARLLAAMPDIVFVGLGFPKQERLIVRLAPSLPGAWLLACGAAIPFAAGTLTRAPIWMQKTGMEWAFRVLKEPRRLFRRYLVNDLPFAATLLASATVEHVRRMAPSRDR